MVHAILPHFRAWCRPGGALAHPQLLRDARRLYVAAHSAMLGTALPVPRSRCGAAAQQAIDCTEPGGSAAEVECEALLAWLLVSLSLALPLLAELAAAARLFGQHARQRAAAGLPPERGLQAGLYRAVGWLLLDQGDEERGGQVAEDAGGYGTSHIRIGAAAYLLLCVSWDASIWLAHRPD